MERRDFLKATALSAIAISASGFIGFNGKNYVGDCETTTDVLGPFYRPDSPVRKNLVIKGEKGNPIELSGKILHNDCTTPYKNAKIELWHCDGNGVYDNESANFRYRGTTYSDNQGNYSFKSILPVPYGNGENFRPAHFHLMITAAGYQPLVTQLYFTGDPWLAKDSGSSSPTAKRRILEVTNLKNGAKKVVYNVGMSKKLVVDPPIMGLLAGVYIDEKNVSNSKELLIKDHQLWVKNEPFGINLEYVGDNTFQKSGVPVESYFVVFEMLHYGALKMTTTSIDNKGKKRITVWMRKQ